MNLNVIKGDITKVYADVIVNAANPKLRGGGGVDGAIHRAAGPSLLPYEAWMFPHGTQVAVPVVTPAFNLPAKWIIHVPGPDTRETPDDYLAQSRDDGLLWLAYHRSLVTAGTLGARTITFPSLSTGIFGFPLNRAVPLALDALRLGAGRAPSVVNAAIVAFDDETFNAFREGLK